MPMRWWKRPKTSKGQKKTTEDGGVRMQTRSVNGEQVVWIEDNILNDNKGLPDHQFIAKYIAEHIGEVYTIIESGQKVYIGEDLPSEYTQSKYTQAILKRNPSISRAKKRASANLGEMIEIATNRRWERTKHAHSKDAKYGMYRYDTQFGFPVKNPSGDVIGANIYSAELLIRNASDGKKYLYDIVSIKKNTANSEWLTQRVTSAAEKSAGQKGDVSKNSIRNNGNNVNKKFSDRDYMDAVNRGDMRTAQRMVDEAAKQRGAFLNNDEANEIFKQSGEVRTFYHGTNTGDFTVFDKSLLGNSSGDMGWFGKGFYFAFSSREAATYGGRVINAYLKMRKPYDYSQLYKFKGSDYVSDKYSRLAWLYNIVKQFPDIVSGQKVYAYPNDAEDGAAVSWKQLAGWMDRIEQEAKFSVEQVETPYGDIAWELRANPKEESFTNDDGETFTWTEYGMRQMFANERDAKEPINQIGAYLSNVMGVETIPRRSIEKIDFSGAVQRAGYDGIIQSPSGDEAVVFDSSQIKSSDPVTYDDNGNVIPLSKRFDRSNPDIRYSDRDPAAGRVNQVLQSENAKLKEDVQYLKDLVKLQKTVTGGTKFTKTSVESMAGNLMKANNARGNKAELAKLLNGLYEYIAKGEELSWDGVKEMAQPAVDWLRSHTVIKSELSQYAQDILHDVRTSRISLDESQMAEAAYRYGSYNDFRKAMMGSVIISKDGVPLDIQWQE